MKTKNSKPTQHNPRGGIAGTIAELTSTISSNQQMNMMMEMMNKQQQSSDRMMQMMMMMMGGKFPSAVNVTPPCNFPHFDHSTTTSSSSRSIDNGHDVSDLSNEQIQKCIEYKLNLINKSVSSQKIIADSIKVHIQG